MTILCCLECYYNLSLVLLFFLPLLVKPAAVWSGQSHSELVDPESFMSPLKDETSSFLIKNEITSVV